MVTHRNLRCSTGKKYTEADIKDAEQKAAAKAALKNVFDAAGGGFAPGWDAHKDGLVDKEAPIIIDVDNDETNTDTVGQNTEDASQGPSKRRRRDDTPLEETEGPRWFIGRNPDEQEVYTPAPISTTPGGNNDNAYISGGAYIGVPPETL